MKSSADSISILPLLSGRDAVAIRPSGAPVLKEKGSAAADVAPAKPSTVAKIASEDPILCMISSLSFAQWASSGPLGAHYLSRGVQNVACRCAHAWHISNQLRPPKGMTLRRHHRTRPCVTGALTSIRNNWE